MKITGLIPPNVLRLMPTGERARLGKTGLLPEEALAKRQVRLERDLQRAIGNLLNLRGIAYFRQRMDKRATGTAGWPDFTFAVNGRAVAWEIKLPGTSLDPDQVAMIARMATNGWHVCVIRSVQEAIADLAAVSYVAIEAREDKCVRERSC